MSKTYKPPVGSPYTATRFIEASHSKAAVVYGNSDFSCTYPAPIPIKAGDTGSIFQVSLDSQGVDPSNFYFPEDVTASIIFSYYVNDYNVTDKVQGTTRGPAWPAPTYKPCAGYAQADAYRLDSARFNCLQESDDFDHPVIVFFTAEMSYIGEDNQIHTALYSGIGDNASPGPHGIADATPVDGTPIVYLNGTLQFTKITSYVLFPTGGEDPSTVIYEPTGNAAVLVRAGQLQLRKVTTSIVIPAGPYDRVSLCRYMTKELAYYDGILPVQAPDQFYFPANPLLLRTDDVRAGNLIWHIVADTPPATLVTFLDTNCFEFWDAVNARKPKIAIGASQISIVYGNEGSEVVEFTAAQTPLYDNASPGVQCIGIFPSGTVNVDLRYNVVTAHAGIVIHDLQPRSFWFDTLGFDAADILTTLYTDTNGVEYYQLSEMNMKTVQGFASIQAFFPTYNPVITDPVGIQYIAVDANTVSILGQPIVTRTNLLGGFYIVQAIGWPFNSGFTYTSPSGDIPNVVAVVSKEYDNNNVVTGFPDSGPAIAYNGVGLDFSECRIRILTADGNLATDLGPNNIVVFRLDTIVVPPGNEPISSAGNKTIVRQIERPPAPHPK